MKQTLIFFAFTMFCTFTSAQEPTELNALQKTLSTQFNLIVKPLNTELSALRSNIEALEKMQSASEHYDEARHNNLIHAYEKLKTMSFDLYGCQRSVSRIIFGNNHSFIHKLEIAEKAYSGSLAEDRKLLISFAQISGVSNQYDAYCKKPYSDETKSLYLEYIYNVNLAIALVSGESEIINEVRETKLQKNAADSLGHICSISRMSFRSVFSKACISYLKEPYREAKQALKEGSLNSTLLDAVEELQLVLMKQYRSGELTLEHMPHVLLLHQVLLSAYHQSNMQKSFNEKLFAERARLLRNETISEANASFVDWMPELDKALTQFLSDSETSVMGIRASAH